MEKDDAPSDIYPTAQTTAVINQTVPIGTVISYVFNTKVLPPGWLVCDGSTFSQAQYPELYAGLGKNTLPNLSGYFLRGLDTSGTVDPNGAGRTVLSVQPDEFASHTHVVKNMCSPPSGAIFGSGYWPAVPGVEDVTSESAGSGNETRPKNVAVLYLIFAGLPQQ